MAGRQRQARLKSQKKSTCQDTQALLVNSTRAVVHLQSEFHVGSSAAFVWFEASKHVFRASGVPAPRLFHALFSVCAGGLGLACECRAKPFGHSAHEVCQLALCFSGPALQLFSGSGSFPLEHWAKIQKLKKECGHNADCPKAHIVALVVDGAGLLHLHKACLFQQGDSPLITPLADTGITGYGSHVYVDEAIFKRRCSQAERSKVKVGQDSLYDDLTRLTPF